MALNARVAKVSNRLCPFFLALGTEAKPPRDTGKELHEGKVDQVTAVLPLKTASPEMVAVRRTLSLA